MVARAVALPRGVDAFDVGRADLAVDGGGVEDFVATALDDAGLVHVDMAGVGSADALPGQEDRVDDGGVRLGTAKYTSASGAAQACRIRSRARSQCSSVPYPLVCSMFVATRASSTRACAPSW